VSTDRRFDDFTAWRQACDGVGLNGPTGLQGKGNFQYLNPDGSQAAFWRGDTDTGVVYVDIPDTLVNVPSEDDSDGQ
jgi:hypothetical protein